MILTAHGHTIDLDPGDTEDLIARRVAAHEDFYERRLLEDAYHRAPSGTVVDVGAHVGNHTLWFAGVMRRHVVAVEPYPPSVERLRGNIAANLLNGRVHVVEAACGATPGYCRVVEPDPDNTGTATAIVDENGLIPVVTVDQVAEEPVALIKIDVEGQALAVLAGAVTTLSRTRPLLYIEAAETSDRRRIDRWLERRGYRRFARFCSTPTYGYEAA